MAFVNAMRNHSVFSTKHVEEAEAIICQSLVDARIMKVPQPDQFGFELNMVNLGTSSFVSNRYDSYTEIESGESGIHDNTMHFICGGGTDSLFSIDEKTLPVSSTKGVVLTPRKKIRVERPPGSEILIMRVNQSILIDKLSVLLDQNIAGTVDFHSEVDLSRGAGASLKRLAINLVEEMQQSNGVIQNTYIQRNLEEIFIWTLLQLPHTKYEALTKDQSATIAPRTVVRAEEYMRAHLAEPITITDILSICGCSRTALFSCFKKTRGYTPLQFLSEQRLLKARRDITKSSPQKTIAVIALDCGFTHLGRFSQQYRRRFGELPSETERQQG